MTFPHLIVREVILFQVVVIGLALVALLFDAPLEGIANPLETPNPAKAPWYFLGPAGAAPLLPAGRGGRPAARPGGPGAGRHPLRPRSTSRRSRCGRRRAPVARRWASLRRPVRCRAPGGLFGCWPIAGPDRRYRASPCSARLRGERGGRLRRALARVTLPEWIMTWFVVVATLLTAIGTFFRGPGWSWVWPW